MMTDSQTNAFKELLQNYTTAATELPPDPIILGQANTALTAFTQHPSFTDVALRTLKTIPLNHDELNLATTFLMNKFKYDFELLDHSKLNLYYQDLIRVALIIPRSTSAPFNAISQSLAFLYIHVVVNEHVTVTEYVKTFLPNCQSNYQLYNYYFKILEEIASAVSNSRVVLDEALRIIARQRVESQQLEILNAIEQYSEIAWNLPEIDSDLILECFTSWSEVSNAALEMLPSYRVMHRLMEAVQTNQDSQSCLLCLKTFSDLIHNRNCKIRKEILRQEDPLFEYLGSHIIKICNRADQLILNNRAQDAEQYIMAVMELATKAVPQMLDPSNNSLIFLAKVANYTACLSMTQTYGLLMDFWEDVLKVIYKKKDHAVYGPILEYVSGVYKLVCSQCQYTQKEMVIFTYSKQEQNLSQDLEQKDQIRTASLEFFELLAKAKGHCQYIDFVIGQIQSCSRDSSDFWSKLESLLFSLVGPIKRTKTTTESTILLINSFEQMSDDIKYKVPVIVKKTFLKIFTSLLGTEGRDRELVKKLFYVVSTCFQDRHLGHEAERAFCKGCEANGSVMWNKADELVDLIRGYPSHDVIVRGVTSLVCSHEGTLVTYLPKIFEQLLRLGQLDEKPFDKKYALCGFVEMFKIFRYKNLSPQHMEILVAFISRGWDFLTHCLTHPANPKQDEDKQVELTTKLFKLFLRVMKLNFTSFIEPLYNLTLQAFKQYPICSYVYLFQILITCYSGNPQFKPYILFTYDRFFDVAVGHLQTVNDIQRYSLLIDDFIGINKRIFIYNSSIVLESGKLPQTIEIACKLIDCQNLRIMSAVHSFFQSLFMVYWPPHFIEEYNNQLEKNEKVLCHVSDTSLHAALKPVVLQHVGFLICKMLEHLSMAPPSATTEYILDTIIAEIKAFPFENQEIWSSILQEMPVNILLSSERERFLYLVPLLGQGPEESGPAIGALRNLLFTINRRLLSTVKRNELSRIV